MARDTDSHSLILPDIEMIQNWLFFCEGLSSSSLPLHLEWNFQVST